MKLLYCVIYYIVLGAGLRGGALQKAARQAVAEHSSGHEPHPAEAHAAEEDDRRLRQPSAEDASGDLRRGVHTCAAEHSRLRRSVHRRRSVGLDNFNSILPCGKPPVHHHTALQPTKAAAP